MKLEAIRKEMAWAIYYEEGGFFLPFTVRSTRRDCIKYFEEDYAQPWEELKNRHRCFKIYIVPAK